MAELVREQSAFGASIAEIGHEGGSVAKKLVTLIPIDFEHEGFKAVVDGLVFSLSPGDCLIFPDYGGYPRTWAEQV